MANDQSGTLAVRIAKRREEAADIISFELAATDGGLLPAFSAGSHIDVRLGEGMVRQYSLCNAPTERHRYLIAVLKEANGRGGSKAMHERLRIGDVLEISAPRNHFPLAHAGERSLLLAGGIGVTPILCMAERLSAVGVDFEMHYCTRNRDRTAFTSYIANSGFASRVHFHFDDGADLQRLDIPALLNTRGCCDTHIYVCGPKGFMDMVLAEARRQGWPEARLHYEFFSAEPVQRDSDKSFEVQLASSGKVFIVPPDQSASQVLAEAGIEVPTSCEQGVCGTCVTRVLEGAPDHRDLYFTPEEQAANDQFTPCCSRALSSRLVLDL